LTGPGLIGSRRRQNSALPSAVRKSGLTANRTARLTSRSLCDRDFQQMLSSVARLQRLLTFRRYRHLAPILRSHGDASKAAGLLVASSAGRLPEFPMELPNKGRLASFGNADPLTGIRPTTEGTEASAAVLQARFGDQRRQPYQSHWLPSDQPDRTSTPFANTLMRRPSNDLLKRFAVRGPIDTKAFGIQAVYSHRAFAPSLPPILAVPLTRVSPPQENDRPIVGSPDFKGHEREQKHLYSPRSGTVTGSYSDLLPQNAPRGRASDVEMQRRQSGRLVLDGSVLGQWVVTHLEQELSRPQAGITGVDPRAAHPRSRLSPF
jgi:hypothetical protein